MNGAISTQMSFRTWLMLLVLSVLWGGSFFFTEIAIREIPPLTLSMLRVSLAALVFWIFMLTSQGIMPKNPRIWGAFVIMGFLNNAVPFTLIAFAQTSITSSLASIINSTTPLFAVVIAGLFLPDERITPARVVSVVIGLSGVVVMIGPSVLQGIGSDVVAQSAMLGAAVFYASSAVYARRFKATGLSSSALVTGQVTMSSDLLVPVAFYFDQPLSLEFPSTPVIASVIGVAFLSTALAYILYFKILASAGATNVMLVTFLIPISAILLGVGVLGEVLTWSQTTGMVLIGLGLAIMDGRLFRRKTDYSRTSKNRQLNRNVGNGQF